MLVVIDNLTEDLFKTASFVSYTAKFNSLTVSHLVKINKEMSGRLTMFYKQKRDRLPGIYMPKNIWKY